MGLYDNFNVQKINIYKYIWSKNHNSCYFLFKLRIFHWDALTQSLVEKNEESVLNPDCRQWVSSYELEMRPKLRRVEVAL